MCAIIISLATVKAMAYTWRSLCLSRKYGALVISKQYAKLKYQLRIMTDIHRQQLQEDAQ